MDAGAHKIAGSDFGLAQRGPVGVPYMDVGAHKIAGSDFGLTQSGPEGVRPRDGPNTKSLGAILDSRSEAP